MEPVKRQLHESDILRQKTEQVIEWHYFFKVRYFGVTTKRMVKFYTFSFCSSLNGTGSHQPQLLRFEMYSPLKYTMHKPMSRTEQLKKYQPHI